MTAILAPRLETERLILRPHQLSDFAAYREMWTDPIVLRYTIVEPRTAQDAWMTLQRVLGGWVLLGFGLWALELKQSGEYVGDAGFMDSLRPTTPDKRGQPEMAYALSTANHGKGLMSEALAATHAWLDAEMPGIEAFALIDDDNTASIRVAEKHGYRVERRADHDGRKTCLYVRNPLPQGRAAD